ncbi:hypothetical protein K438DRAFT_1753441 [Mycena galopus ATCC 62051]|nr:hypothetical protein K438DRAFT_1753441 [Mycena galopus ATCC 62051]
MSVARPSRTTKRPTRFESETPSSSKKARSAKDSTATMVANSGESEDEAEDAAGSSDTADAGAQENTDSGTTRAGSQDGSDIENHAEHSPTAETTEEGDVVMAAGDQDTDEGITGLETRVLFLFFSDFSLTKCCARIPGPNTAGPAHAATAGSTSPTTDPFAITRAFPDATTESQAVALLNALGAEPGALVGLDLQGLNGLYRIVLQDKLLRLPKSQTILHPEPMLVASAGPGPVPVPHHPVDRPELQPQDPRTPFPVARVHGTNRTGVEAPHTGVSAFSAALHDLPDARDAALAIFNSLGISSDYLVQFTDTELKARHIFPLHALPASVDWGVPTSFDNASNLLCEKDTSDPLIGWALGEVTYGGWLEPGGMPAARVMLAIQPISTHTVPSCIALLQGTAMPRQSSRVVATFRPEQIKATKWMNHCAQGGAPAEVVKFAECYDATAALRAKEAMVKLNPEDINVHDLVLVEVKIGWWNAEKSDGTYKKRVMNTWQSYFELQAFYLIKKAPTSCSDRDSPARYCVLTVPVPLTPVTHIMIYDHFLIQTTHSQRRCRRRRHTAHSFKQNWLWFLREKEPTIRANEMYQMIKQVKPAWTVSKKRYRVPEANLKTASVSWYYEAFAPVGGGGIPLNPVMSKILRHEIKGDALLTITTPEQREKPTEKFSFSGVLSTIWWYLTMETDAAQVARERTLERMLMQ